jgi:multiple sugar transport system ATP-binding protein
MAEVAFENVDKEYASGRLAVAGVSLRIADAERMVVVGPSGCGKSTLLRLLAGLESVTRGTVQIGGRVVNDLAPQDRNVAMVFQDYALYPHRSVRGNLEFPLRMRGMARDDVARRVERVAQLLGLGALLDRLPKQLSGGERQRVAMGRALVREPTVFLLDEPLSNLDAKLRTEVRAEIAELQRRTRTTMLYVTHDQVEAMTLGDRITVLDRGRVQQIGTPREVYEQPANAFVAGFIGNPPMTVFPTRLSTTDGEVRMAVGAQSLALSGAAPEAAASLVGRALRAGIRAEDVRLLGATPSEAAVAASVEHVERLGHETLAALRIAGDEGGVRWIVRLPAMQDLAKGQAVRAGLDARRVHLFAEDGAALAGWPPSEIRTT